MLDGHFVGSLSQISRDFHIFFAKLFANTRMKSHLLILAKRYTFLQIHRDYNKVAFS